MDLLNDPEMREVVEEFCDESIQLFGELEAALEVLEEEPGNSEEMERFGQVIDRVMGSASTLGADEIATFCELGKIIGYKASQIDDEPLLTVVVAVLFDAVDILKKMIDQIRTGNDKALKGINTSAFVSRLKWLSEKFKDIERASVSFNEESTKELDQNSIDDLMASLGL